MSFNKGNKLERLRKRIVTLNRQAAKEGRELYSYLCPFRKCNYTIPASTVEATQLEDQIGKCPVHGIEWDKFLPVLEKKKYQKKPREDKENDSGNE